MKYDKNNLKRCLVIYILSEEEDEEAEAERSTVVETDFKFTDFVHR